MACVALCERCSRPRQAPEFAVVGADSRPSGQAPMAAVRSPVVWTSSVRSNGFEFAASIVLPGLGHRPRGVGLLASAAALCIGCTSSPRDDVEFTAGSSGGTAAQESSDSGDPPTTTAAATTMVPSDSTGAPQGCVNDGDCIDSPDGPHCDPETQTCGGECVPGDSRSCYSGPLDSDGVGACKAGLQACLDAGIWASFCDGEVVPTSDDCNSDGVDDDCDGLVDDTDLDGDGFGACTSDCCDVDGGGCEGAAFVNPGAYEVLGNGVDDDCDEEIDEISSTCDAGLASSSSDALVYARAMELCQFTEEDPADPNDRVWGVIDASFSRTDGADLPLPVQRSLRSGFGNIIDPEAGDRLVVLSTGHAADATDANPAYAPFQNGVNLGTSSAAPADWLAANGGTFPNPAGCIEPDDIVANDPIMLNMRVRVPTNARSFSVMMQFFSAEYPEWVCSQYNDFFLTLVGSTADNPADGNIAVYDDGETAWPVGVNLVMVAEGLFTQCENGEIGCSSDFSSIYEGCLGTALLVGTGFDAVDNTCDPGQEVAGGGTGWLKMSGNVTPGETVDLRFAIWDTSGHLFDSVVLLDDFTWSLDAATPGVAPG